jgi:hypothetical protein
MNAGIAALSRAAGRGAARAAGRAARIGANVKETDIAPDPEGELERTDDYNMRKETGVARRGEPPPAAAATTKGALLRPGPPTPTPISARARAHAARRPRARRPPRRRARRAAAPTTMADGAPLVDFFLDDAELAASPSRADGVAPALEAELRRYACDVAAEAAALAALPQAVAATAQVLLHRFYCRRSLAAFDVRAAAPAALWLAAKLEEAVEVDSPERLRLRDVLAVAERAAARRDGAPPGPPLDPASRRYEALKAEAVRCERHMLRALGFVLHMDHPHRFVLTFGQLLGAPRAVLQEAWNLANDSLRGTLCVRRRAEVVACGALFAAARRLREPMPETPPWWEVFGVARGELAEVCAELDALAAMPRARYTAVSRGAAAVAAAAAAPAIAPAAAVEPAEPPPPAPAAAV